MVEATQTTFLWPDFVFCLIFAKRPLHVSNYSGCNCKEDISASSLLGILFERIPCKSLIASPASPPPEQNGSWSFSRATELNGSWGRFQRNRLSFQNYKKSSSKTRRPPCSSAVCRVFLFCLFFAEWGDLRGEGGACKLPDPAGSSAGGGYLPDPCARRAAPSSPKLKLDFAGRR